MTASVDYVRMTIYYIVPGTINWFTVSSGGSPLGTGGSPFNPVGVTGSGLPDTNTPGTFPFYAECSTTTGCRSTVANFVITANNTVTLTSGNSPQTVCINTALANITYSTTGATGATVPDSLPACQEAGHQIS